jgi:hypothetical protein
MSASPIKERHPNNRGILDALDDYQSKRIKKTEEAIQRAQEEKAFIRNIKYDLNRIHHSSSSYMFIQLNNLAKAKITSPFKLKPAEFEKSQKIHKLHISTANPQIIRKPNTSCSVRKPTDRTSPRILLSRDLIVLPTLKKPVLSSELNTLRESTLKASRESRMGLATAMKLYAGIHKLNGKHSKKSSRDLMTPHGRRVIIPSEILKW